jgi:hypothetical protein
MRKKLFGMMAALLASAGVAHAQQSLYNQNPGMVAPAQYGGASMVDSSQAYPGMSSRSPTYAGSTLLTQGADPAAPAQNPMTSAPGCSACQGCTPGCEAAAQSWKVHGWLGGDFLMYFPMDQPLPANLVTTGPAGTGTQLIGTSIGYPLMLGFRIDTGLWLDSDEKRGTQAMSNILFRSYTTVTAPGGSFINPLGPFPVGPTFLVGPGGFFFQTWSQFSDNDANSLYRLVNGENTKVYLLYGPKFVNLEEDINMSYNAAGFVFNDDFHTRNLFFGGNLGVLVKEKFGAFTADLEAKCAIGWNYNNTIIFGSNDIGGISGATFFTGRSNVGYYETNSFGVIPEINGNIAYQLTEKIQIRAGYNFLLWTDVVRPGNQMAPITAPVPGVTVGVSPQALSTFIIHGVNFGATWKY